MDHGILNVPLDKRGNIDARTDIWKEQEIARQNAMFRAGLGRARAERVERTSLLAGVDDEKLKPLAERVGITVSALKEWIASGTPRGHQVLVKYLTERQAEGQ